MTRPSWDERIRRADELARSYGYAAEVLKFYKEVLGFQKKLYAHVDSACGNKIVKRGAGSLRDHLDLSLLLPSFRPFLSLVERTGPPPLTELASQLTQYEEREWEELFLTCWNSDGRVARSDGARHTEKNREIALSFFSRAFLQPYAQHLADHSEVQFGPYQPSTCPLCYGKPQVGVLRPEGYGGKRSLICSLCSTEWDYLRILCPACGEHRFDRLFVFTASELEYVRVETCQSCMTYIKTVDLTKNGLAVPLVDELATIPLDLWAKERGYVKLKPNLLGI